MRTSLSPKSEERSQEKALPMAARHLCKVGDASSRDVAARLFALACGYRTSVARAQEGVSGGASLPRIAPD